jgi:hypothetical protein
MTYIIKGSSQYGTEELDETDNLHAAQYLVQEYRIAFGAGWRIWYVCRRERAS